MQHRRIRKANFPLISKGNLLSFYEIISSLSEKEFTMSAFEWIVSSFLTLITFLWNDCKLVWKAVTLFPFFNELFPYNLEILRLWLIFIGFKDRLCLIASSIIYSFIESYFELTLSAIFNKWRRFITLINFSKPITAIIWCWLEYYVFTHTVNNLFTLFALEYQWSKLSRYLYCLFLIRVLPFIEFDHIWCWNH